MRILIVSTSMALGGAEVQAKECAVRLRARGHTVMVVSLLPFEAFREELEAAGVASATLGMVRGVASVASVHRFRSICGQFRPDVIHAHMFAAVVLARVAALGLRRRPVIVGTSHASFEPARRRYLAYRLTDRFGDVLSNVSEVGATMHVRARAVPREKAIVVPNGVDLAAFDADFGSDAVDDEASVRQTQSFTWLAVGSFRDEAKDFSNLLNAFATLRAKLNVAPGRLLIAGDGELLPAKKRLAQRLGVADSVAFLGAVRDMPRLMARVDAFVLSSKFEALPMVVLEAAAAGLPIVATDVGDVRAIFESSSVIVPPEQPQRLADAMLSLETMSTAERSKLGAAARARARERHDIERVVDTWVSLYERLLRQTAES